MQRLRTLAVIGLTLAIAVSATPPPATESPPDFAVSPLERVVKTAAAHAVESFDLVLNRAPDGDAMAPELLTQKKSQRYAALGTSSAAEPSSTLTPNARGRPRGDHNKTTMAAKLHRARTTNYVVRRASSAGIRLLI